MSLSGPSRPTIGLLIALVLAACGRGDAPENPAQGNLGTAGMPAFFPAQALLLKGPPDLVLAEGEHGILLTLAEYNGRAFEERLPADLDTLEARSRYLSMLIDYKVAAVEARLQGYIAKDTSTLIAQERDLAQQLLQQSILTASNIPDAEALAFVRDHPDEFPGVDMTQEDRAPDLMHAKYKMQDRRLREQLESWKLREKVVVYVDRLAALAANAGAEPSNGTTSTQETTP